MPGCETLPVFGVFDLHANFTAAHGQHANGLVAYRENPHTDARESAVRSAQLLAQALKESVLPRMLSCNAPVMWPPTGTGTADRPMRDLEALARRIEQREPGDLGRQRDRRLFLLRCARGRRRLLASSSPARKRKRATRSRDSTETAVALRDLGLPAEWDLDDAVAEILRLPGGPYHRGRAGRQYRRRRAGRRHLACCAPSCATASRTAPSPSPIPRPLRALAGAKPGETRRLSIGGKGSAIAEGPVEIEARFVSASDGDFALEDLNSHLAASQGVALQHGAVAWWSRPAASPSC